jgi:hypothetical protein
LRWGRSWSGAESGVVLIPESKVSEDAKLIEVLTADGRGRNFALTIVIEEQSRAARTLRVNPDLMGASNISLPLSSRTEM